MNPPVACPPPVVVASDAPTIARTVRVRPGESFALRLPVPDRDHTWTLEIDRRELLSRDRLPELRRSCGGWEEARRFRAEEFELLEPDGTPAKPRVVTVRGRCAVGGGRPAAGCRIEVVIAYEEG